MYSEKFESRLPVFDGKPFTDFALREVRVYVALKSKELGATLT